MKKIDKKKRKKILKLKNRNGMMKKMSLMRSKPEKNMMKGSHLTKFLKKLKMI